MRSSCSDRGTSRRREMVLALSAIVVITQNLLQAFSELRGCECRKSCLSVRPLQLPLACNIASRTELLSFVFAIHGCPQKSHCTLQEATIRGLRRESIMSCVSNRPSSPRSFQCAFSLQPPTNSCVTGLDRPRKHERGSWSDKLVVPNVD